MIYETSPSLREEKTEKTEPGSQTEAKHKRVRKSGGKARSRDSETSERAQYAISPSAQLVTSESQGVMKLEAAKFKPREVVKHVLQTAAASLQKILTLEGHVADDVPKEVIGDVLRIRQILTNLISNAIKFTHEGKVRMKLYVVPAPSSGMEEGSNQKITTNRPTVSINVHEQDKCISLSQSCCNQKGFHEEKHGEGPYKNHTLDDEPKTPVRNGNSIDGGEENPPSAR
ncbi:hypothetical protein HYC85_008738 [Camellia sinensis]|uniref:histidine kinase n=1 Tax=Camellia sinensis TaxID=4442 RepID=A0A7J7HSP2_CAMSI|nr:hypothetical protein HYC85_008738 [Camellia sinensis]